MATTTTYGQHMGWKRKTQAEPGKLGVQYIMDNGEHYTRHSRPALKTGTPKNSKYLPSASGWPSRPRGDKLELSDSTGSFLFSLFFPRSFKSWRPNCVSMREVLWERVVLHMEIVALHYVLHLKPPGPLFYVPTLWISVPLLGHVSSLKPLF